MGDRREGGLDLLCWHTDGEPDGSGRRGKRSIWTMLVPVGSESSHICAHALTCLDWRVKLGAHMRVLPREYNDDEVIGSPFVCGSHDISGRVLSRQSRCCSPCCRVASPGDGAAQFLMWPRPSVQLSRLGAAINHGSVKHPVGTAASATNPGPVAAGWRKGPGAKAEAACHRGH